ncbi:MAG: chitosanase [Anaerocolumna sp.]
MLKKTLNKKAYSLILSLFFSLITLTRVFGAVTDTQRDTIFKLTSIFENSTTTLQYTYVENIGDGRGLTFGFAGFCSGTYDGTLFLKEYQSLNTNNILVKYIPAFERIDSLSHPGGLCSDTTGLANFPADFRSCGNDPAFKEAQHNLVNRLYWNPSQEAVNQIGAQYAITAGELYDSFINHGADGAWDIINQTNSAVGKISNGTDEKTWLSKYLSIRYGILASDPTWSEAVDRVKVYQKLLNTDNNVNLSRPITVTCYGDTFTISGGTETVAAPVFNPAGGTYSSALDVTISSATAGASIRYTTDGSTPTASSALYTGPISVKSTKTIKAIAIASGMTNSTVTSAAYTIKTSSYSAWAPYTYYSIGSIVSYSGTNYRCIQAHTSLPGWEPSVVPALWQPV